MITKAVDTIAEFLISGNDHGMSTPAAPRVLSETNVSIGQKKYSRDATIPQESASELKGLFTVAGTSLTQTCCKLIKREATACGVEIEAKLFADMFDETHATLQNVSRTHTISI